MKLQLFLDNHEIDLNGTEVFPVNKTYENLENPMDIISEYTKSINIPMSVTNNKILANSYRLDREIIYNDNAANLGLYFDPNKRIPMRLVYNNDVILDGYAKYVSSTTSSKDKYYTLTLFGVLGDIFLKLKKVVVSKDRLTQDQIDEEDGGLKYILNDYHYNSNGEPSLFNMDFVNKSWDLSNYDIGELDPTKTYYENGIENVYGAAPTYCGYYPDFDSTRVQTSQTDSRPISQQLREAWMWKWRTNNNIEIPTAEQIEAAEEFVDNLDPDEVVGDGFKDYQMRDYRAYKQRPFIYFNKLLYMFKNKISELSDYKLVLDDAWFNISNPYWSKLCYMFDFLQQEGQEENTSKPCFDAAQTSIYNGWDNLGSKADVKYSISTDLFASTTQNTIVLRPFSIGLDLKTNKNIKTRPTAFEENPFKADRILPTYTTSWQISITCNDVTKVYYASTIPFKDITSNNWFWDNLPTESNFLPYIEGTPENNPFGYKYNPYINEWCAYINIPSLTFMGDFSNLKGNVWGEGKVPITINISTANTSVKGKNIRFTDYGESYFQVHSSDKPQVYDRQTINIFGERTDTDGKPDYTGVYRICVSNGECEQNKNEIEIGLRSFYKKEEPLFDIILQYSKMFGLKWNVDYINKEIQLVRRETLFQNYTIENWDDKLDRTQQVKIEPVVFPNKYLKFAYKETDGYKYTTYREKYGVEFGDRIVNTLYNFNSEDKVITNNISPTIASNRNFISFENWLNWDLRSKIISNRDEITKLECATEDDSSSIDTASWCFRTLNTIDSQTTYYVTEDSDLMLSEGKSYYYDYRSIEWEESNGYALIDKAFYTKRKGLPLFSPIYKSTAQGFSDYGKYYSCLFNTPMIDYTSDQSFTNAIGNTVYDICWDKFINERYNAQNKKMTAYFNLSLSDYNQFKFNKFVNVDNQLFMVNRILDFEPTQNKPTQCELIQITDISAYTEPRDIFDKIQISSNAILVNGVYTLDVSDDKGVFEFIVRSYPTSNLTLKKTSANIPPSKNGKVELSNIEEEENIKIYNISYDLTNASSCSFIIQLEIDGDTTEYACLIQKDEINVDLVTTGYDLRFSIYEDNKLTDRPAYSPIPEIFDDGDIKPPTELKDRLKGVKIHQVGNIGGAKYTNIAGFCTLSLMANKPIYVVVESPNPSYGLQFETVSQTPIDMMRNIIYPRETSLQQYLINSYTIKSRLIDKNGVPIANAVIEQGIDDSYEGVIITTTDNNGEFELKVLTGFNDTIKCSIDDKTQLFYIPQYYESVFVPAFEYKMINI